MSEINVNELTKKDFCFGSSCALVSGLWRDYAILAQAQKQMPTFGRKKRRFCVRIWYRMLQSFSILHEYLWLSLNSWKGTGSCNRSKNCEP